MPMQYDKCKMFEIQTIPADKPIEVGNWTVLGGEAPKFFPLNDLYYGIIMCYEDLYYGRKRSVKSRNIL